MFLLRNSKIHSGRTTSNIKVTLLYLKLSKSLVMMLKYLDIKVTLLYLMFLCVNNPYAQKKGDAFRRRSWWRFRYFNE